MDEDLATRNIGITSISREQSWELWKCKKTAFSVGSRHLSSRLFVIYSTLQKDIISGTPIFILGKICTRMTNTNIYLSFLYSDELKCLSCLGFWPAIGKRKGGVRKICRINWPSIAQVDKSRVGTVGIVGHYLADYQTRAQLPYWVRLPVCIQLLGNCLEGCCTAIRHQMLGYRKNYYNLIWRDILNHQNII